MHRLLALAAPLALAGCGFSPGAASSSADAPPARVDAPIATADAPAPLIDAPVDAPPPPPDAAPVDTDGDGVPDSSDNCPTVKNADQADEDADGVGDVCDNCPHVPNPGQENVGELDAGNAADTVGDACDPQPTLSGNRIVLFLPFNNASEIAAWSFAGNVSANVTGGSLVIDGTDLAILFRNGLGYANAWVTTTVSYGAQSTATDQEFFGASIMTRFARGGSGNAFGTGGGCGETRDTGFNNNKAFDSSVTFGDNAFHFVQEGSGSASVAPNHTAMYTVHGDPQATTIDCAIGSAAISNIDIGTQAGTGLSFAVWGTTASFHYLVVIE